MTADTGTRLFHISDDSAIEVFEPRPVLVPSERPPGMEWLNGPLVWAVSEERLATYLFPRDCPRILVWPTPKTTDDDRAAWFGDRECRMIAHIEWAWFDRMHAAVLYRYEFAREAFEPLDGGWMAVSRRAEVPIAKHVYDDLFVALAEQAVELRVMRRLTPLRRVWDTSLHASGIRLRNAQDW